MERQQTIRWALVWLRRDLRLSDQPALQAALRDGMAPLLVYIDAPEEEAPWQPGAATRQWLRRSLFSLAASVQGLGSRLIIRKGPSEPALLSLIEETGASAVYWSRVYEPELIRRDQSIKSNLKSRGIVVQSVNSHLLVEPWEVQTGQGEPYRVFTPFWRAARARLSAAPLSDAPSTLPGVPAAWHSESIETLIPAPRPAWDQGFWQVFQPGERGAHEALDAFADGALRGYKEQRNRPDRVGTSRLSPHLHFGEISVRQVRAGLERLGADPALVADHEHYLSELGWREFAHHLLYHFPHTTDANMNPRFADFDWREIDESQLRAWQQGRTGVPIVDAGMRELWHTGWMHNRVRMIVASYLCKNLRFHWRHGARWFWDTLLDADLANNSLGWQWSAGTGADAAPYFRIFSPVAQSQKFDARGDYVRRWVPELSQLPSEALAEPWLHPRVRTLAPDYPAPIIDLKQSRADALAAYRGPKSLPGDEA